MQQSQLHLQLLQSHLPSLQEQPVLPFPAPAILSTKYAAAAAMIAYVSMACIFLYNNSPMCQKMNDTTHARQVVYTTLNAAHLRPASLDMAEIAAMHGKYSSMNNRKV